MLAVPVGSPRRTRTGQAVDFGAGGVSNLPARAGDAEESSVDAQQAQANFQRADVLFKQGKYADAFRVLMELNIAFPNSANVLYPMALCLEKLGQAGETMRICNILIEQFQDGRAQALRARLMPQPMAGIPGLDGLNLDVIDSVSPSFAPPKPLPPPSNTNRYILLALGVLIIVGLIAGLLVTLGSDETAGEGGAGDSGSRVDQLDQLFKDSADGLASLTARTSATFQVPGPSGQMSMSLNGTMESLDKDNKECFRLEGSLSGAALPGAMNILMVSTGDVMYQQIDMMGQKMVMKQPAGAGALHIEPADLIPTLVSACDIKEMPDELVDGKSLWVFELKPKPGASSSSAIPIPMAQLDHVKLSVDGTNLSQLKVDIYGPGNVEMVSFALSDIRLNAEFAPDRFEYTPPAGVPVQELPSTPGSGGMMPFMGQ